MGFLTIFTPTYNREYTLQKLYLSLKNQSCKDFLWLIIDDGSTDNTRQLVEGFIDEDMISIQYYQQVNQGKYVAHNNGVNRCFTPLFVCVDSDDYLLPNAVQRIKGTWEKIKTDIRIGGIVSPRKLEGDLLFSNPPQFGTLEQLYSQRIFSGDTMLVYRTDILKRFPFPVFSGEKFMSEGAIYIQIDQSYVLYYLNEHLYVSNYLADGLSINLIKHRYQSARCSQYEFYVYAALKSHFLERVKNYGCYLGWTKALKIDTSFSFLKIGFLTRISGAFLKKHYYRYFSKEVSSV